MLLSATLPEAHRRWTCSSWGGLEAWQVSALVQVNLADDGQAIAVSESQGIICAATCSQHWLGRCADSPLHRVSSGPSCTTTGSMLIHHWIRRQSARWPIIVSWAT